MTLSLVRCVISQNKVIRATKWKERSVVEGREKIAEIHPTLYNSAYLSRLFHDGREISLENLVWDQLTGRNEMAMTSIGQVIDKIRGIEDYQGLFV